MKWIRHEEVIRGDDLDADAKARAMVARMSNRVQVSRHVLEGMLGTDGVPAVSEEDRNGARYEKTRLYGHPALAMTTSPIETNGPTRTYAWASANAHAAWRIYAEGERLPPPRRRTVVVATGDEKAPYLVRGTRIRPWNSSQDLPKELVGATAGDPDGNAFLSRLGRRWRRIAHALVMETVKDALRPVPGPTEGESYWVCYVEEGSLIRKGRKGAVWLDAAMAVHLAGLAGYPLGDPDGTGGDEEEWTRLSEILRDTDLPKAASAASGRTMRTETLSYDAFAAEVGLDELRRAFPEYRWGRGGRQGERLREDASVSYSRALYEGNPAMVAVAATHRETWLSASARDHLTATVAQADAEGEFERALGDTVARPRTPRAPAAPAGAPSPLEGVPDRPARTHDAVIPCETPRRKTGRRRRKAIARVARAIARLAEEDMALYLHGGVLKAGRSDPEKMRRDGLTTVVPGSGPLPVIEEHANTDQGNEFLSRP